MFYLRTLIGIKEAKQLVRKMVDRVTVTGADDSVRPEDLIEVAEEFPYAEFGILLSKSQEGAIRFPSRCWLERLCEISSRGARLRLSGHICGQWVKNICAGGIYFFQDMFPVWKMFGRLQLNFHAQPHKVSLPQLWNVLEEKLSGREIILQADGVNDHLFGLLKRYSSINVVPLFDLSGGRGEVPDLWPVAYPRIFCGYAGGLSPQNLQEQLGLISQVAGPGPIWIDSETLLRSFNSTFFDLEKVRQFLDVARPWVI